MADAKQMEFGARLAKIDRTHRQLSQGYVTSMNHDGLIIARPHKRVAQSPLRGVFLGLAVLLTFKAFVYAQIGPQAYSDRVGLLEAGTIVERIGAYAMHADPITIWIAAQISSLM